MKSTTVLATAILLVWGCQPTKRPPEVAATPKSTCLCDYEAHERCPDLEAEMDRSTPGCVIPPEQLPDRLGESTRRGNLTEPTDPPEALPQHKAREHVFENKDADLGSLPGERRGTPPR